MVHPGWVQFAPAVHFSYLFISCLTHISVRYSTQPIGEEIEISISFFFTTWSWNSREDWCCQLQLFDKEWFMYPVTRKKIIKTAKLYFDEGSSHNETAYPLIKKNVAPYVATTNLHTKISDINNHVSFPIIKFKLTYIKNFKVS